MAYEKLSAHVRVTDGTPTLYINDRPVSPILYGLTRKSWDELSAHNIRLFARAGVHLHQVDLSLSDFSAPARSGWMWA